MEKLNHEKTLRMIINLEYEFNSLLDILEDYVRSRISEEDRSKIRAWIQKLCAHCCALRRRYNIKSFQKRNLYIAMLLKNVIRKDQLEYPFNKQPHIKELPSESFADTSKTLSSNSTSSLESLNNNDEIKDAFEFCSKMVEKTNSGDQKFTDNDSFNWCISLKRDANEKKNEVSRDACRNTLVKETEKSLTNVKPKHQSCQLSLPSDTRKGPQKSNHSSPDNRAQQILKNASEKKKKSPHTSGSKKKKKWSDFSCQFTSSQSTRDSSEIKWLYKSIYNEQGNDKFTKDAHKRDARAYLGLQSKLPLLTGGRCFYCDACSYIASSHRPNMRDVQIQTAADGVCNFLQQEFNRNLMDNGTQCYYYQGDSRAGTSSNSYAYIASCSDTTNTFPCGPKLYSDKEGLMNLNLIRTEYPVDMCVDKTMDCYPKGRKRQPCIVTLAKYYENKFPDEPPSCDNTSALYCTRCKQCAVIRGNCPSLDSSDSCDCSPRPPHVFRCVPIDDQTDSSTTDHCSYRACDALTSSVRCMKQAGGVVLMIRNQKCAIAFQDVLEMCSAPKTESDLTSIFKNTGVTNNHSVNVIAPKEFGGAPAPAAAPDSNPIATPGTGPEGAKAEQEAPAPAPAEKTTPTKDKGKDKKKDKKKKKKGKSVTEKINIKSRLQSSASGSSAATSVGESEETGETEDSENQSGSTAKTGTTDESETYDEGTGTDTSQATDTSVVSEASEDKEKTPKYRKLKGNLKTADPKKVTVTASAPYVCE